MHTPDYMHPAAQRRGNCTSYDVKCIQLRDVCKDYISYFTTYRR